MGAHAWNSVLIRGENRFIDTTWAAGNLNGESFKFQYDRHYFLTPPYNFFFDHFPNTPEEQFLSPPLTIQDYIRLPFCKTPGSKYDFVRILAQPGIPMSSSKEELWELCRRNSGGILSHGIIDDNRIYCVLEVLEEMVFQAKDGGDEFYFFVTVKEGCTVKHVEHKDTNVWLDEVPHRNIIDDKSGVESRTLSVVWSRVGVTPGYVRYFIEGWLTRPGEGVLTLGMSQ
ncbi:hypothetical protein HDU76_012236, partial [Blyttiomyces sp. JEL0837]